MKKIVNNEININSLPEEEVKRLAEEEQKKLELEEAEKNKVTTESLLSEIRDLLKNR